MSLMIMIVMVIIAVITVRVKSQMSNNHHEMTRSDSDRRLSQSSHGYCTTISSDVAVSKKQIFKKIVCHCKKINEGITKSKNIISFGSLLVTLIANSLQYGLIFVNFIVWGLYWNLNNAQSQFLCINIKTRPEGPQCWLE